MKFSQYVGYKKKEEKKKIKIIEYNNYLEFGISKKNIKRIFDYTKSWLIRYKINFKPLDPYVKLFNLNKFPNFKNFKEEIQNIKDNVVYYPTSNIYILPLNKSKYITINYENIDFHNKIKNILFEMNIGNLDASYLRLFEVDSFLNNRSYEDMLYSCPELPNIKLNNFRFSKR